MDEKVENVLENETENTEAQTVEQNEESIELTDTAEADETEETNAEETEEEQPKGRYVTDEELNDIVNKRVARKMRKFERENETNMSAYKDTEDVLKSALGVNDITEANHKLREYYAENGIKIPEPTKPGLSSRQIEILAKADAQEFIDDGYDSMVEEANRLANIGYKNLNEGEKIVFNTLAEKLTEERDRKDLQKLGANADILSDKDFKSFRDKFNSNVPISEIFSMYQTTQPKKEIKPLGSMKDTNVKNHVEKEFYSPEDVKNLTQEDWDKPGVWEKVLASQRKWKK